MVTPNTRGKMFEYSVLYKLKKHFPEARRVLLSGSLEEKGDILTKNFFIECKKTMHNSIRVTKEWLKKVKAQSGKRVPLLIFSLAYTEPYVILSLDDFISIVTKK